MSKYEFSESMEVAAQCAREWFIANGCPWETHKGSPGKRGPVPTKSEIELEYLNLFLTAKTHNSQFCESGELLVELIPLRYGYRPLRIGPTPSQVPGPAKEDKP